ncbi:hypothetical protein M501DRAFT_1018210 [Patellaria atrata CBS 101060]|uniref:Uncharacterized protein n=1 Tax=Patellaria atrata CBS 101060 TaxID=1346257 RepID=A0A9P4S716_9PEZI|nr:hypothetical protein M501DRAFT_1018210 [Patellaria atrata CBS 101060]
MASDAAPTDIPKSPEDIILIWPNFTEGSITEQLLLNINPTALPKFIECSKRDLKTVWTSPARHLCGLEALRKSINPILRNYGKLDLDMNELQRLYRGRKHTEIANRKIAELTNESSQRNLREELFSDDNLIDKTLQIMACVIAKERGIGPIQLEVFFKQAHEPAGPERYELFSYEPAVSAVPKHVIWLVNDNATQLVGPSTISHWTATEYDMDNFPPETIALFSEIINLQHVQEVYDILSLQPHSSTGTGSAGIPISCRDLDGDYVMLDINNELTSYLYIRDYDGNWRRVPRDILTVQTQMEPHRTCGVNWTRHARITPSPKRKTCISVVRDANSRVNSHRVAWRACRWIPPHNRPSIKATVPFRPVKDKMKVTRGFTPSHKCRKNFSRLHKWDGGISRKPLHTLRKLLWDPRKTVPGLFRPEMESWDSARRAFAPAAAASSDWERLNDKPNS